MLKTKWILLVSIILLAVAVFVSISIKPGTELVNVTTLATTVTVPTLATTVTVPPQGAKALMIDLMGNSTDLNSYRLSYNAFIVGDAFDTYNITDKTLSFNLIAKGNEYNLSENMSFSYPYRIIPFLNQSIIFDSFYKYEINNTVFSCTKSPEMSIICFYESEGESDWWHSAKYASKYLSSKLLRNFTLDLEAIKSMDEDSIIYLGKGSVEGRPCENFKISLNSTVLGLINRSSISPLIYSLAYSYASFKEQPLSVYECIDDQYGYGARIYLPNSSNQTLINVTLSGFSLISPDGKIVPPPVQYIEKSLRFVCSNSTSNPCQLTLQFDFTSLVDSTNTTFSLRNIKGHYYWNYSEGNNYNNTSLDGRVNATSLENGKNYTATIILPPGFPFDFYGDVCLLGQCTLDGLRDIGP